MNPDHFTPHTHSRKLTRNVRAIRQAEIVINPRLRFSGPLYLRLPAAALQRVADP